MKVIVYHFWSPTCGPCKDIKPLIESLKEEFSQLTWLSVNTHDDPNDYKTKFGVQFVPTLIVAGFNDAGKLILTEKQSGTNIPAFYRILRAGVKFTQQS